MASSSSSNDKKVVLISSDKESFEVSESAALLSVTIKNILEDAADSAAAGIPLGNVDSKTLGKVIEFCNRHAAKADEDESKAPQETLKQFNEEFVEPMDHDDLFDLILAANYLNIKILLDVVAQKIADQIQNISAEECRDYFNIKNDFTEEEEEKIRKENEWAYDLGNEAANP